MYCLIVEVIIWREIFRKTRRNKEHEVSGIYAGRIYEKYGSFAVEVMEQNPYRLVREVDGIGFLVADNIAKGMGMDPCGRFRVSAALDFQLQKIALYGHCCIPDGQLVSDVEKGIGVPRDIVWEVMKQDLAEGLLAQESVGEDVLVYPDYLYRAERETAQRLLQIQREAMPVSARARVGN